MKHVLTLPGDWTSPWIMLRLLQVVESPWEATEEGFLNAVTGERATLAMGAPIEGLARVFSEGTDPSRPPLEDALIENLEAHHAVVQVSNDHEGEDFHGLLATIRAANAVVDAGALAVQVASSGLAHGADAFQALVAAVDAVDDDDRVALRRALFPVVVRFHLGRDSMTIGMHALGRPDVVLEDSASPDRAVGLLERAALAPEMSGAEPDQRSVPEAWKNPFGMVRLRA